MNRLSVLVGCEESQAVCHEFLCLGHDAYSCDLLPCSGGHPQRHIQKDIFSVIAQFDFYQFDLIICFPPCTDLAASGARHFQKKRLSGEQEQSINFFLDLWLLSDAIENPVGIMSGHHYIKKWFPQIHQRMTDIGFPDKPSQIIQPWQFGHGEQKATCLWLKDLPFLKPTNIVDGRDQRLYKLGSGLKNRAQLRSKTYPGVARAIAQQWSQFIMLQC